MSAPVRLYATRSSNNPAVTLYNSVAKDVAAEPSGSTPRPQRSKRTQPEDDGGANSTISSVGKSGTGRSAKRVKVERVANGNAEDEVTSPKQEVKSPRPKAPKKQKPVRQSLDTPHPTPEHWKEQYETIKSMRARLKAPVDTMGCDQAQNGETDPKNRRFATLVSLMLSSQTKDEITDAAISKLRAALGGSISVDGIIDAEESTISQAIDKVGFWRRKTGYLKKAAQKLRDDFDSDVPKTVDELCSLPGVGPKMAFLALQTAWKLNAGIGVDVHVHRITNRLQWHKPPTKNPEETRLNLQSWLPSELHGEINHRLVGFGQTVCLPVGPRCDLCELNAKGPERCPSAQKVVNSKNRKTVVMSETAYTDVGPKVEIKIEEDPIAGPSTTPKLGLANNTGADEDVVGIKESTQDALPM
ncbi:DNA glycosylase [Thelephora terrestris]|uniref:Endonuclease III homolog n=1 Tax=Thelephora terrestris TaxID=56493 RepID=A0A9P6HIN7_9AGAM|nr:DNA glycosylase [Thelephora terrestris]